jgi:glycosyltransferase involved in cell wall biosynthesis
MKNMKIIISHPTGNANVRAATVGLANAKILAGFYTTVAMFSIDQLDKVCMRIVSELSRRKYDDVLQPYTHTNPWMEAARILALKLGLKKITTHEIGALSVDAIYKNNDRLVAAILNKYSSNGRTELYAYEDGAENSFNRAKNLGIKCNYDLPIGYWRAARRLLSDEVEKWPEWASTLSGFKDSEIKLARKDNELRLADHIFVASSFTAKTLNDYPGKLSPISIIPYGFPHVNAEKKYSSSKKHLKILFVGGLSQRKGIANLFAAIEPYSNYVRLTVVGRKVVDNCEALNTALAKHNWIPSLPHSEILKLMREHDVFVFPSLFEGFGLVITEAMSQGTPVITTDRTAGPDLIQHGKNGWIVEAGSTIAIQKVIEDLLTHPELVLEVGLEAMKTAKSRPWSVYGADLANTLMNL